MKKKVKFLSIAALGAFFLMSSNTFGQDENEKKMQYFRDYDQTGVNVFESPANDETPFNGLHVKVGGNFAQQFQALWHTNGIPDSTTDPTKKLIPIHNGFNLATANFNIDAQLEDGIRLHLVTYLSARHHPESWVKGGYIQFDKLTVLNNDFINGLMENMMIKVGHMEINYGDMHFRRTDNANAMWNPFVGNYILDAFNTEVAGEIYWRKNGIMVMGGISEGLIKPDVGGMQDTHDPSFYYKLGYDNEAEEGLRFRITLSNYIANKSKRNSLYAGDRAGSRFYYAMEGIETAGRGGQAPTSYVSQFTSGRYSPGYSNRIQAFMINPFVKYNGLELFMTYEMASGWSERSDFNKDGELTKRNTSQIAADLIYRFFEDESFFVGARYNTVTSERVVEDDDPITINRIEAGFGWFITKNVLVKGTYVTQDYVNYQEGEKEFEGNFHGFMVEAAIGF